MSEPTTDQLYGVNDRLGDVAAFLNVEPDDDVLDDLTHLVANALLNGFGEPRLADQFTPDELDRLIRTVAEIVAEEMVEGTNYLSAQQLDVLTKAYHLADEDED